jgi:hypothetical protein
MNSILSYVEHRVQQISHERRESISGVRLCEKACQDDSGGPFFYAIMTVLVELLPDHPEKHATPYSLRVINRDLRQSAVTVTCPGG